MISFSRSKVLMLTPLEVSPSSGLFAFMGETLLAVCTVVQKSKMAVLISSIYSHGVWLS